MPTISVLMPVFNAAPFLKDCLDSVVKQRNSDWELIAIDDFSTDSSLQILQNYASKDVRIKVFPNLHKGIIPALRLALEKSNGQWISRMDADDRMAPNKLEQLKKALDNKGRGYLAVGQVQYFAATPLGAGYKAYESWLNTLTAQSDNFRDRYRECVIPSPCWMIHREDLLACQAFNPDRYPEDYDLCFRFFKYQLKIAGVPEVLHYWRDHPSRSSRTSAHYADNRFLELKVDYFAEFDLDPKRPLFLWGAGKKGKYIARLLQAKNIAFQWLTNNPAKIGHNIYDIHLQHFSILQQVEHPSIIISVATPSGKTEISQFTATKAWENGLDFFWFC